MSAKRNVAALLVAAATPAMIIAVAVVFDDLRHSPSSGVHTFEIVIFLMAVVFIIALLHAVFLGLPAYFVLKRLGLIFWWMSMICGFVIALVPFVIFSWPASNASYRAWDGKEVVDYVINGVRTHAGWIQFLKTAGFFGFLGMSSGLAGWLTWRFLPTLNRGDGESSQ